MGVVALAFWNAPNVTTALWVYLALFSLSGIPGAALTVGLFTTIQTTAPAGVLGRVTGVLLAAEAVGAALGSILAGFLVDHLPLDTLLDSQAGIYLGCGLLVFAVIRSRPRASDLDVSGRTSVSGRLPSRRARPSPPRSSSPPALPFRSTRSGARRG